MSTPTIEPSTEPSPSVSTGVEADPFDPFELDITFIENTPAADSILMCSTGDNCGSSCPSACTTS